MRLIVKLRLCLITLSAILLFPLSSVAEPIKVVTEHLPPYQFIGEDNRLTGISVEIVNALFEQAKVNVTIEVLPWAQAYEMALNEKNVMIFSITRSKERQNQFKWVGDFIKQNYYFLSLKSRHDIKINNIQDVKKYMTGVSRDSFEHQLLKRYGFSNDKNLLVDAAQLSLVEKLYAGKVDLLFGSKITLLGLIGYVKQDVSAISMLYQINETPGNISIAFSKKTDDKVVKKFRTAFKAIKSDGKLDRIMSRWLGKKLAWRHF